MFLENVQKEKKEIFKEKKYSLMKNNEELIKL
jgi:hypothetical protein